ncbi:hypothetical protein LZ30DRAFT_732147 [Colletotrichum cereale]|nr:hypothetical protein LZ30DRAFT_732147 [Colletotrichum cereale]
MVLMALADRRGIVLSEFETSSPLPPPCSNQWAVGRGPPSSLQIQETLEHRVLSPCLVRNLEMDHRQSGTDQPSRLGEAKSQNRFDGVENAKGGDEMSSNVRFRQVAHKVPVFPPLLDFLNGFWPSLLAMMPTSPFVLLDPSERERETLVTRDLASFPAKDPRAPRYQCAGGICRDGRGLADMCVCVWFGLTES